MSAAPLTLGTAGHIDHGKSALVRALTGVDTDRLPEEQRRGISIELGYARLDLPSGAALSVIDVPGHERYVRTMVAGATGIDLFLMVIAADDGVMPQTREHAAVLRALGVTRGVVAVTKSDLADPDLAILEAEELLPGVPAVAVSARTGAGLDALRAALDRVAVAASARAETAGSDPARLHVDRVFTIRGAGTVVTGTLWSGEIARGDAVTLLPGARPARAREVQVHGAVTDRALAGQRVAVNLSGIAVAQAQRGDVLTRAGAGLTETYRLDCELAFDDDEPETGDRVQVHHGTRETPARLAWLGGRFWQVRLELPLIAADGDRIVLRQIAPPDTLGGGRVLDARPRRHGPGRELTARLERRARGEPDPEPALPAAARAGRASAVAAPGTPSDGRAPEPPPLPPSALALEQRLHAAGFAPPIDAELDPADLAALRAAGRTVRIGRNLHFHTDRLAELRAIVIATADRHGGEITIAQLRDVLQSSRKFAQGLLEHFDAERVTIRRGDVHVVRRSARSAAAEPDR
ncbi:MAG TPA: selenocysteine-specific translation elongation factor [Solirubrobacteraceae bacterium]|nr:selenocysteine-specific translation elongation factor [Solirubrobacteraceae bacterium]